MSQKRILIIDDETTIRWVLKAALESDELTIFEADCGQDGIRMASETSPDLIIMDYKMPDMNGWQVTREILKNFPDIPIIGHTGYANKQNLDEGMQSGCVDILHKPVDLDRWEETITKYL